MHRRSVEILLVEDNWSDAVMVRNALKEARVDNNLSIADSGEEALKFLAKEGAHQAAPTPDIILLDLNMPGMGGIPTLRKIKSSDAYKHIPVIALTGSHSPDDVREVYANQGNCYLVKPIDVAEFMDVIRALDQFWLRIVRLPAAE